MPGERTITTADRNFSRRRHNQQLERLQECKQTATDVSYLYHGLAALKQTRFSPRPPDWPAPELSASTPAHADAPLSLARYVSSRTPADVPATVIPAEFHLHDASPLPPVAGAAPRPGAAPPVYDPQTRVWTTQTFPTNLPTSRAEVIHLARTVERMLQPLGKTFSPPAGMFQPPISDIGPITSERIDQLLCEVQVWDVALHEVTRQVYSQCAERGALLSVIHRHLLPLSRALLSLTAAMHASQSAALAEAAKVTAAMASLQQQYDCERQELADKHKQFIAYLVQGGEDAEQSGRLWGFDFKRNALAIARASAAAVVADHHAPRAASPPPPATTDMADESVGFAAFDTDLSRAHRNASDSAADEPPPTRDPEAVARHKQSLQSLPNKDGLERLFAGIKQRAGLAEVPDIPEVCIACGRPPSAAFCCHDFSALGDKCGVCCGLQGSAPCRHLLPKPKEPDAPAPPPPPPVFQFPKREPAPKPAEPSPLEERQDTDNSEASAASSEPPKLTPPGTALADLAQLLTQAPPKIAELLERNKGTVTRGQVRSVKWLNGMLLELYLGNPFEAVEPEEGDPPLPLAGVYQFFRMRFPVKKTAHDGVLSFFATLRQHARAHQRVRQFIRWAGLGPFAGVNAAPCSKQAFIFYRELLVPLRNGLNKAQTKALEDGELYIPLTEAEVIMESALENVSVDVQRIAAIKERTRVHLRTSVEEGQLLVDAFLQFMVDAHESLVDFVLVG